MAGTAAQMVVNCFQIVFLLWSLTTGGNYIALVPLLWIAFKLYFYCGLWQLIIFFIHTIHSCELLSNCIFTVVFDNAVIVAEHSRLVVNCFQIVFLLWSLTTLFMFCFSWPVLWIAFKLYFYCGLWQQSHPITYSIVGCELLSNCIFTVVFDNSGIHT